MCVRAVRCVCSGYALHFRFTNQWFATIQWELSFHMNGKRIRKKLAITQISVTFIVFHTITFYVGCFHSDWLRILSKLHWSNKCTLGFVRTLNFGFHWPFRFQLNGYEQCNFEIYAFTSPGQWANGQILAPFQHTNRFHYNDYISLPLRMGDGETWTKWRPFCTYIRWYINR